MGWGAGIHGDGKQLRESGSTSARTVKQRQRAAHAERERVRGSGQRKGTRTNEEGGRYLVHSRNEDDWDGPFLCGVRSTLSVS
eukprot:5084548-Pleurochrysis_carterae.AAC.1